MKQKILPLLAFAVAMLVSITANAQGKKITVEPTQKAQLEKFMPVQINNISPKPFNLKQSKKSATPMTMAEKKKDFANAKMVTNHRSAKTAKRQIKASANNNITIGDFYASTYDTEYYISMTDEASTMQFLFDINTTTADFELGKTYTLEDMYVDYTGIGDADDWYVWTVVTAATYTETKDAQGLTHVVASMTDEEGNTYNITYDQPTPSPKEFVADDLLQEDYETDMYLVLKNAASDTIFYFDIYYTGSFEYGKTYTVEDMDSYYSTMEAGGYYNDYKEASITVTEDKDGLTHIVATVTLKNGEIYNITYDEPAPTPSDPYSYATFDFSTDEGLAALGIEKPESGSGTNITGMTLKNDVVSMTSTDGTNPCRVWNNAGATDLRMYKSGGSFTISVPTGYKIISIDLAGTACNYFAENDECGTCTKTQTVWDAPEGESVTSKTFTATGTGKISTIKIKYMAATNTLLTAGYYEITANITANEGVEVPSEMQKYLGGYTAQGELTGDSLELVISTFEEGFILNGFSVKGDAVILNDEAEVVFNGKHFQLADAAGNTNGKLAITKTGENEYALADGTIVYMGNVVGTVTGITFKMIEDPTTAINNVDAKAVKSGKFLENGKLVIIKNGVKYNVIGINE